METLATRTFSVPTREEVSANNQAIFDNLQKQLGFVPNLYAYYAKNDTALVGYLDQQSRKSTLKTKEKEVINLVVSQINECQYCLAAHTAIAKMNGFSDEQIIEIRRGAVSFDEKFNALAKFAASVTENHGRATEEAKENFFEAGYDESNLIDAVMVIGEKITSNYLHNLTQVEVDFPLADEI